MRPTLWSLVVFVLPIATFAQEAGKKPSFVMQMVPFVLMFLVFYFLVMRPQAKKQKNHQDFVTALKKGDKVLTNSGIFGTVEGLNDKYVILEIAQGVKIRLLKTFIAQSIKEGNG